MGISEREHHIKVLEKMFYGMEKLENGVILPTSEVKTALAYAISSLKTDLKYDLVYEGEEIYTKADMVAMLKDLRLEIEKIFDNRPLPCSHYQRTLFYGEVDDLILDKINALKEASDA